MKEWIEVESAVFNPHSCVGCRGVQGPMVDTMIVHPQYGRIYICTGCVKRAARILGFAKGTRLEELSQAAAALGQRDKAIEEMTLLRDRAEAEKAAAEKMLQDTSDELGLAYGRIKQLEERIAGEARAALELVGVVEVEPDAAEE